MSQELWNAVDHYFDGLFLPEDQALTQALKDSDAAGLDPIAVAPNQGKLLYIMAQLNQAKRILEIGALGGYSTLWMAKALPEGGKLVTLEIDDNCAKTAQKNIERAGLQDKVEIKLGPALYLMNDMVEKGESPFDLIFIDADKENYPGYFEYSMKLARKGTLIIADNVVRQGAVIDADSPDTRVQGVRQFNQLVATEPRVTTTVIQTVGSKGHDGLGIVLVTSDSISG